MVFTKLSVQEKNAFFGLLDEYFQSRPELLGQSGSQGMGGLAGTGISTAAATSVVQRALAANAATTGSSSRGASGKSNNPYGSALGAAANNVDVAHAVSLGRVAAASLAFSQPNANVKPGSADGPPSLPRRIASNAPASVFASASEDQGVPGSEVDKLVTRKTSVFSSFKKPPTAGVAIPPAFVAPKSGFGPPPVRRATSETHASAGVGAGAGAAPSAGVGSTLRTGVGAAPRAPQPAPLPEEEVAEGEWAEVLYDYSSEDQGDLSIEAGTRVFVTDKSSEDWWSGQVEGQGKEGLFPAAYVKLL